VRTFSIAVLLAALSLAGCSTGSDHAGSAHPVTTITHVDSAYGHIPVDVTSFERNGSSLDVKYSVLFCSKPDGVSLSFVLSGSKELIAVEALSKPRDSDNCDTPVRHDAIVQVSVLDGAKTFVFDTGDAGTSGTANSVAPGDTPGHIPADQRGPHEPNIAPAMASKMFSDDGIAQGEYACRSTDRIADLPQIGHDFDFLCVTKSLLETPCSAGGCAGYLVDFHKGHVESLAKVDNDGNILP
jgi:hypothetical protein